MIAGIDLGTSTSAIGYFTELRGAPYGRVDLVPGGFGYNWMPSAVLYDPGSQDWVVGTAAQNMRKAPDRAPYYVVSAKRHLGVNPTISMNGSTTVMEDGREVEVTPQLLLSKVLRHLKSKTEERSPDFRLDKVVVAIPMVYMSHEASLTKEAVELAGLELEDFIQEPTAAALCYVHDNVDMNTLRPGEKILIFDLGGGTFDITVFQLVAENREELELDVLATEGVRTLGGDDVDTLIVEFLKREGLKLPRKMRPGLQETLLEQIESSIKVPLSNNDDPDAQTFFHLAQGSVNFGRDITLREFRHVLSTSVFATSLRAACQRVHAKVGDVDRVMMVGGSSQLPVCRDVIREQFGDRVKINSTVNVQEAVVRGAVYRAAQLNGRPTGRRRVTLRNNGVLSHDFGVLVGEPGMERFRTLIPKHTPYPMLRPIEQRFRVGSDSTERLIIDCAQGDAAVPFAKGESAHQVFNSVDHGLVDPGEEITIRFQANHYGEILFSSTWNGGNLDPLPLRPGFGS